MKFRLFPILLALTLAHSSLIEAATTITGTNAMAYGANIGWIDWRGDTNNGAVIGDYVCSGYIYSANVGWIHLGSGNPANRIRYQNNSASDYGVNQDGLGNLQGLAYGANIGWVNFETNGQPRVDLVTGRFSGSIWSANCGWIGLSNAFAFVQTSTIDPGADTDHDGIPDTWELTHVGALGILWATGDADGDGFTDLEEYLADTNPLDPTDNLRITFISRTGTATEVRWTSQPTRSYVLERRTFVDDSLGWQSFLSYAGLGWNDATFESAPNSSFYRVRAIKPLSP